MHELVNTAASLYENLTTKYDNKAIANGFWSFSKKLFLSGQPKVKMVDYAREIIMHTNEAKFEKTYKKKLCNIKKTKGQLKFTSEVLAMMLKSSGIQFLE